MYKNSPLHFLVGSIIIFLCISCYGKRKNKEHSSQITSREIGDISEEFERLDMACNEIEVAIEKNSIDQDLTPTQITDKLKQLRQMLKILFPNLR
ncbi:MAG: phage host-nuclease inhibitor protein Gam [Vicingaceae bacterium]|jgi:phage host-nuclease inhibitor protein Gam